MGFLAGPVVAAVLFLLDILGCSPLQVMSQSAMCKYRNKLLPIVGGHQHCQQQRRRIGLLAGTSHVTSCSNTESVEALSSTD